MPFAGLERDALFELFRLRIDVFVVEQTCAYAELDDYDVAPGTLHLLVHAGAGELVGCARLITETNDSGVVEQARIGRVATRESWRGSGVARRMMQFLLAHCQQQWPQAAVVLSAQVAVVAFYQSLGFTRVSEEYVEDGIPHVDMRREVNRVG